jgi:branched-chain amino acid aminotransferase
MTQYAFFEGQFVPIEQARVSIMTHTFNYGTGVFGGLRGYWNDQEQQLFVFRIHDHYRRFLQSCKLLYIDLPYDVDDLVEITLELLRREGYREDAYIRPIGYKSTAGIGVRAHNLDNAFAMFTTPFGRYIQSEEGARAMVSSWRRIDDNVIPARGKVIGGYANSALAKTEAVLNGYDEAIVLDQNGHVSEGSAENLFIVRDGRLITPPIYDNILEGITRRTIIQLARDELGIETDERTIDRSELYVCDEAFFCGTGVQVCAIIEVDHRPVGTGRMGPVVNSLRELYFDVVRGRVPKYRDWCNPVYVMQPVAGS